MLTRGCGCCARRGCSAVLAGAARLVQRADRAAYDWQHVSGLLSRGGPGAVLQTARDGGWQALRPSQATPGTATKSESEPSSAGTSTSGARVAFMVTRRTKEELAALGYAEAQVRGMAPGLALAVVQASVPPSGFEEFKEAEAVREVQRARDEAEERERLLAEAERAAVAASEPPEALDMTEEAAAQAAQSTELVQVEEELVGSAGVEGSGELVAVEEVSDELPTLRSDSETSAKHVA